MADAARQTVAERRQAKADRLRAASERVAALDEGSTEFDAAMAEWMAASLSECSRPGHLSRPVGPDAVYFFRAPHGRIKIGTSTDVPKRKLTLERAGGAQLETLATTPGGVSEERALHVRFAHLRAIGEWFDPGDDLLAFIDEVRRG